MEEAIVIRLRGEGIKPGLIRSHEIADILCAVEDFVVAEAMKRNPNFSRDELVVGLYEISDQSVGLKFKTTFAAVVVPAFIAASQAIAAGDFEAVSAQSLKPLQAISSFSRRHGAIAEFKIGEGAVPIAEITPATVIPEEPKISGATEITAKILRVGGKVPKAMLELQDGTVIYCELPVEKAIELGHRLYDTAVFSGYATWNGTTLDLEDFTIYDVREAPSRDPYDVLSELRVALKSDLRVSGSVSDMVRSLRGSEDAE